ncbi:MAG: hypothetical protein BRD48_01770 [Bacteroidetes bacterium QS_9_68_14]|nr:MAG: hypothetical protein BRD48_01770 [Bacteroidetes bacterium QS_9_68_14]
MTDTTQKLIAEPEAELDRLPEDEQEERAASYLDDVRSRPSPRRASDEESERLYESFRILRDAELDLPPDYSETYEERLHAWRSGRWRMTSFSTLATS